MEWERDIEHCSRAAGAQLFLLGKSSTKMGNFDGQIANIVTIQWWGSQTKGANARGIRIPNTCPMNNGEPVGATNGVSQSSNSIGFFCSNWKSEWCLLFRMNVPFHLGWMWTLIILSKINPFKPFLISDRTIRTVMIYLSFINKSLISRLHMIGLTSPMLLVFIGVSLGVGGSMGYSRWCPPVLQ